MVTKNTLLFLLAFIIVISCTENFRETPKASTSKIGSITFKYKDEKSKAFNTSRVVDNAAYSYNLGYQFGCAVAKNPSLLTQPQTVYPGLDLEQYTLGFNQGYAACHVSPPPPVGQPSNPGGGAGGCIGVDCTFECDPTSGQCGYSCAPSGYVPCIE